MDEWRIVVVGGANVDVVGYPDRALHGRDSNPGHVRTSAGGVGRNIAENLVRLGASVELITALGSDPNATFLAEECVADRIGIAHSLRLDEPGSLYLAILDPDGDMALGLSDMRALDALTPAVLTDRAQAFADADLVVADANLGADSIEWLARHVTAPLVLDAVSTTKAPRCARAYGHVAALTCNLAEAATLLGEPPADSAAAARALHRAGVEHAFVTDGTEGVAFHGSTGSGHVPAPGVPVVNATGAGDAFAAGVAYALLAGCDTRGAAECGSTLAALALASARTVSERVAPDVLTDCVERNRA